MHWTEQFADRVATLEDAASRVRNGDKVMVGLPEPAPFLIALGERTDLDDVTLFAGAPRSGAIAAAQNPGVSLRAPFITQAARDAGIDVEVVPVNLQGWGAFAARFAARVTAVLVAEPTVDGVVPPGATLAADERLVQRDKGPDDVVIGIVDSNQPHVRGDRFKVDDFDLLVPLPETAGSTVL